VCFTRTKYHQTSCKPFTDYCALHYDTNSEWKAVAGCEWVLGAKRLVTPILVLLVVSFLRIGWCRRRFRLNHPGMNSTIKAPHKRAPESAVVPRHDAKDITAIENSGNKAT
jgi:hypothetical protein